MANLKKAAIVAALAAMLGSCRTPEPKTATAGLQTLEKQVSLQIAHARLGRTKSDPSANRRLDEAERAAAVGEDALRSGDWKHAEEAFRHAQEIVRTLPD
jgi:hypothetical protein